MKSLANIHAVDKGLAMPADDILEFHAARLLLLLRECGRSDKIDSLTKMAKLDFFVRYPEFFAELTGSDAAGAIESGMIRFHYGPWDRRYYQVLNALRARGLVSINRKGNAFHLELTNKGKLAVGHLASSPEFDGLILHMRAVKKALGNRSGSALKDLIYKYFQEEVTNQKMGKLIR